MPDQKQPSDPVDNSGSPAFVMDGDGMVAEWSPQAKALFGWSRAEAVGKRLSELVIPQRHRASHEAGLKHFMQGGTKGAFLNRPLDITMLHRDGHEFDVSIRIGSETTSDGTRFPTYVTPSRAGKTIV
ncbi:MAG TPA: PAS domain-containing protein [Candidatus Binataceae bacterium]|nr:PAS domain-containing protein [Candidatus Binataceae bacterium]